MVESATGTQRKENSIWIPKEENIEDWLESYVPWENALTFIKDNFMLTAYVLSQDALVILS